jgi:Ca-activated chloride channel family protein
MSFGYPAVVLPGIIALAALAWGLVRYERWRRERLDAFGNPDLLQRVSAVATSRQLFSGMGLRLAAIGLIILALARPQLGERSASLAQTGRDVLVLLDLSRSMNAADQDSSRLALAKDVVSELLAESAGNRFGLIVFGGSAFLQLPLTTDHAAFRRFLEAATTDDLENPSTDLSRALSAAATTFEHEGERGYQTVLLISDGESVEGDPGPVLKRLRAAGVAVFAIGVGTSGGAPIPADSAEGPEKWHRDHIGRVVQSRLEEGDLRRAAIETGGSYRPWSAEVARDVAAEIAALEKRALASRASPERADRFQWPLGLAVLLLIMEPGLAGLRTKRTGFGAAAIQIALASAGLLTGCSPGMRSAGVGERLYREGNYKEAYQAFQQAFNATGDPALRYDIGVVLYRLKQYATAAESFREAAAVPELRQRSHYNLGNSYVRLSEEAPEKDAPLRLAITAYEEALRLDPSDSLAKWNLELALQRRGEDRESGGSSGRGRSADYGQGNQNVPGYEGNPEAAVGAMAGGGYGAGEGESAEELSEAEARALLEAVEREQLTSHEGRPAIGGAARQKDW